MIQSILTAFLIAGTIAAGISGGLGTFWILIVRPDIESWIHDFKPELHLYFGDDDDEGESWKRGVVTDDDE